MKIFSDAILADADKLLAACKKLDFNGIANHDAAEVSKLKSVLIELSIKIAHSKDALDNYASKQAGPKAGGHASGSRLNTDTEQTIESKKVTTVRRQKMLEYLQQGGFRERIGKVYNSFSRGRSAVFQDVPHRRGLPPFDLVVSADYVPVAGFHGIFISDSELMSIVLSSDSQSGEDWEILKRKSYQTLEEMVEMVTLIAAGFDL
ncbi:MAG: hypothetical protein V3T17_00500 [Pseudomonadales bacterium]